MYGFVCSGGGAEGKRSGDRQVTLPPATSSILIQQDLVN